MMDTTGTGLASRTMDLTTNVNGTITTTATNNKRRDAPALNVYVRIRPFIGDEVERGENQNALEVIDQQHIGIKLNSAMNTAIRTIQAAYNEYEVTQIFDHKCSQQELFERTLEQPTNEIFSGSNWLLCTLGLTNSGKTHTMFGTPQDPGLIPKCFQQIFRNVGENIDEKVLFKPDGLENLMPTSNSNLDGEINVRNYIFKDDKTDNRRARLPNIVELQDSSGDLSVKDEHYSVWLSFFELYNENILDLLVHPKDMKTRKNLRLMQNEESTIIKNLIQIPIFDIKEAEDIIKFGYANRATSKTTLNEASSRSHAILCITLITISEFDEEPTMSHMYICDLAGNEPASAGTGRQLAETCNINTSLMTFKDCVRTLNENQTSKKQMLVPYRNSVLTSIFRPFFVGRGRIVVCCNINPCATFVSQTNDLLKFCALAQKTVIVPTETKTAATGLIRAQRKSKQKGPKRLVKDGPLKGKNKKEIIHDEDIQEIEVLSIEGSSFTDPANPKSINYWKLCTKKALDLLQKQTTHRRNILRAQHQERMKTIEYLIQQRLEIEALINEQKKTTDEYEVLSNNLRSEQDSHLRTQQMYNDLILSEKQYRQKLLKLEKEYKEHQLLARDEVERFQTEIKSLEKKIERINREHHDTIQQINRHQTNHDEQEQHLHEEIQRLKRDLGLELYRKQDAEKKARALEDKLRTEQSHSQKMNFDYTKVKHDLKTLQVKYDALQLEMIEMHKNAKQKSNSIIESIDAKTSADHIETMSSSTNLTHPTRNVRTKRRTNDRSPSVQETKKPRRSQRSHSRTSSITQPLNDHPHDEQKYGKHSSNQTSRNGSTQIPIPIKQIKKNSSNEVKTEISSEIKVKGRTALIRGRTKKETVEPSPIVVEQPPSPVYATIERDSSIDRASFATVVVEQPVVPPTTTNSIETAQTTPKPSTFKRIQSLFRPSPSLTGSAKVSRVIQTKSTVVAFGSSTPTPRLPHSILKTATPAHLGSSTPTGSMIKKSSSPSKGKYNLRTRLFPNPTSNNDKDDTDGDDKKSRSKKPQRARK